jgi:hypothetical protein
LQWRRRAPALIDTDPQGSLAHWWNARKAPQPHFVKAGLLGLGAALAQLFGRLKAVLAG